MIEMKAYASPNDVILSTEGLIKKIKKISNPRSRNFTDSAGIGFWVLSPNGARKPL